MATHSSVLAWRIPGTGEPGGLLSMGSHQSGHLWPRSSSPGPRPIQVTGTAVCTVPEGQTDPGKPLGSAGVKQGAVLSSWKSSQLRARRSGKQWPAEARPSKPEPAPFSQGPPAAAHEATQPSLSALQHNRRPPTWAFLRVSAFSKLTVPRFSQISSV